MITADAEGNVVYTDVYNYESSGNNDAPLKEEYKPDGADGILDVVNNSKEWKGNISRAYQYLYEALVEYCILGFTNVSDWTVFYWQSMVENTGFAGENYLYFVSVDKDFPVLDRIKQEKLAYEKFEPWLVPIMVVSVAAFLLNPLPVSVLKVPSARLQQSYLLQSLYTIGQRNSDVLFHLRCFVLLQLSESQFLRVPE